MPKTVDRKIIDRLIKNGIKAYEKKMKEGPPVVHEHTFPKMAQTCLVCKKIAKPDCMPKLTETLSACQARNIILNMAKAEIFFKAGALR